MYCLFSQNKLFTGFISLKNTLAWGPFTLQPRSNPQVRDAAFTSTLWTRHELEISGHFHSEHIIYLHHSSVIQTGFKPEVWGHFHSSVVVVVEMLLYVHRNSRLIRDGSPGRPPRLSHSSWVLKRRIHCRRKHCNENCKVSANKLVEGRSLATANTVIVKTVMRYGRTNSLRYGALNCYG